MSMFFTCSIAFNLQWVFVFGKKPIKNAEMWYTIFPIVLSFLIATPPLIAGRFAFDEKDLYVLTRQAF